MQYCAWISRRTMTIAVYGWPYCKSMKKRRRSVSTLRQKQRELNGNEMLQLFRSWSSSSLGRLSRHDLNPIRHVSEMTFTDIARLFDPITCVEKRQEIFDEMPIDQLLDKYSWAIPDQRALSNQRYSFDMLEIYEFFQIFWLHSLLSWRSAPVRATGQDFLEIKESM